jgi:alkylhydroperoxidase family enzyme
MGLRLGCTGLPRPASRPSALCTGTSRRATSRRADRLGAFACSQINNCAYCLDMHTRDLLKKGRPLKSSRCCRRGERRVDSAGACCAGLGGVGGGGRRRVFYDGECEAARAAFEERDLVDLTIMIGLMNVYNRMAIDFRNTPQAVVAG